MQEIRLGQMVLGNQQPMALFAGMNVLESKEAAFEVCGRLVEETQRLGIPFVFKASFDKANRSSLSSFRGPGLDQGLKILAELKDCFKVPLLTDIHESWQAVPAAQVCDILQLPAFLSRQTDLVVAMARTGAIINIKKAQFLAPLEMRHILEKCREAGNDRLILCERGSSFGYNNLVVDMLGFGQMKSFNVPVFFDVTHSLQMPGALASSAGGRRSQVVELARAGLAVGLAGLFLETHPDPDQALCDGPCALRLSKISGFLQQMKALDALVKGFSPLDTH